MRKTIINSARKISFFVALLSITCFLFAEGETEEDISSNSIDETKIQLDKKFQNKKNNQTENFNMTESKDSNFDIAVNEKPKSSASRLLQLLGALIIICILAYVVIKFLKKSTNVFGVDDPYLKIVASTNIAQGKSVHVITLGDKAYIIGVSDNSINTIGEVEDQNLVNAMNLEAEKKDASLKKDFSSVFSKFFPHIKQDNKNIGREFFASQSDRLNKANQKKTEKEE